ncbi:ATP-binding cassette domain-containing protein [Rhizobium beringeri]
MNIPFELLGQSIDETIRALVRMNPMAKMWAEAEVGNIVDTGTDAVSAHNGVVQVENVSYQYDNGRGANRISFSAEKGRVTFITGESGSGKSTLFKMLLKAIEPPNRSNIGRWEKVSQVSLARLGLGRSALFRKRSPC